MTASKAIWRPIRPVPDDAPPPPAAHYARGVPLAMHCYRDDTGAVMGYEYDFLRSDGTRIAMPLAFCEDLGPRPEGTERRREWRWRWFDPLRPVFALDRLADVTKPVLLLPTAHLANVAQLRLGQEFACVSWAGGLKHLAEVDFSTLVRRTVFVWLPATAERYKVGAGDPVAGELKPLIHQSTFGPLAKLVEVLNGYECKVHAVLVKPGDEPEGFCVGMAFDRGMTGDDVSAWIRARAQLLSGAEALRVVASFVDGTAMIAPATPGAVPLGVPTPNPAPAGEGEPQDWLKQLIRDQETAKILPEVHNLFTILRHHADWKGVIYQDDFAHRVMKRRAPPYEGGRAGEFTDADDVAIRGWVASKLGILRVKKADIPDAVLRVADLNRINPLQDYLNGLKWDNTPRLANWLHTYLGAGEVALPDDSVADLERKDKSDLTRYLQLVGPMWLVGAVKRAFEPGCKFDYVIIFEGEQGKGKSSTLAILGGEFGMDSPISFTHKDSFEALTGKWIVEIPELDAFSKADSTTSKSFFTRNQDRYRLPYARRSADYPRACVFAGTTNENEFFRDMTGNRRYWPVRVGDVQRKLLERDRDQLIAEAVVRYRAGATVYPTWEEERTLIVPEQKRRMVYDPWVMMLEEWLAGRSGAKVTMPDILINGLKLDPGKVDENRMAMRVGRVMRSLGWVKREDRNNIERFYYEKAGSDAH